eukprot:6959619-Heterocapsa_arctica.AAC.1
MVVRRINAWTVVVARITPWKVFDWTNYYLEGVFGPITPWKMVAGQLTPWRVVRGSRERGLPCKGP